MLASARSLEGSPDNLARTNGDQLNHLYVDVGSLHCSATMATRHRHMPTYAIVHACVRLQARAGDASARHGSRGRGGHQLIIMVYSQTGERLHGELKLAAVHRPPSRSPKRRCGSSVLAAGLAKTLR